MATADSILYNAKRTGVGRLSTPDGILLDKTNVTYVTVRNHRKSETREIDELSMLPFSVQRKHSGVRAHRHKRSCPCSCWNVSRGKSAV